MLVQTILLSLIAPLALAQYGGNGGSSSTSAAAASATGTHHMVDVGEGGLKFTPDTITAAKGDIVQFNFYPRNHTVTQSSFDKPCQPLSANSFSSGFMPVSAGPGPLAFMLTVNDTNPIWFYCAQTISSHCQSGMAGVINPPASGGQNLTAYVAAAKTAPNSTLPVGVQGGIVMAANATSTNGTATSSASAGASSSKAAAAGLVVDLGAGWIGSLVVVGIAFASGMLL